MVLTAFPLGLNPAYGSGWTLSGDTGWSVAYPTNGQHDKPNDQQTGSGSVSQDIVGDGTYRSTFYHFTDTTLAMRIRVNGINGGINSSDYQFKNFTFIGVDSDVNGSIDFFLGVYNPSGNNGRLGIYRSEPGLANTGPSSTGISGKPLMAFQPVRDSNFSITDATDSSFNGTNDYFISYQFNISDINSALSGTGYSFSASTPFRFITGTASQDNSFNQDISGMDESGWSSRNTWNGIGVFSDVKTADGSVSYYAVNFDKNTGDAEANPSLKVVQAADTLNSLPISPTKRVMYFQEWNTSPDGTGTKFTSTTTISGNQTVYAIWSDKQVYTVTFHPNG